ncbi:Hypp4927 [Branchiostoma lanceolatum]|uniref:Hypp4926 protein n=1 Tax=Branchiostoma lanceolatum TaxID=7740 RepID=A0A8K0ACC3_BRALA|nr:Hypp4926 [Branchiostoma lanceolatum]CAH1272744.1 Hypp4927 [Branchiostoma lanceolatum]
MVSLLLLHCSDEKPVKREIPVDAAVQTVSAWCRCYCYTAPMRNPLNVRYRWTLLYKLCPHGVAVTATISACADEKSVKRETPVEAVIQTVSAW